MAPTSFRVRQVVHLILFCSYYLLVMLAAGLLLAPRGDQVGLGSFRMLAGQVLITLAMLFALKAGLRAHAETPRDLGLALPRQWSREVGLGALLGFGIKFAVIPVGILASLLGASGKLPPVDIDSTPDLVALLLAGSLAALIEELLFRGYLRLRLAELLREQNPTGLLSRTGLLTSFLFSLGHGYQGLLGILLTGVVGMLLFAVATSRRFNLGHAIVAHATFNAISFLLLAALESARELPR